MQCRGVTVGSFADFHRPSGETAPPATLTEESFHLVPIPRYTYILPAVYLSFLASATLRDLRQLFVLTEARLADPLRRVEMKIMQLVPPVG